MPRLPGVPTRPGMFFAVPCALLTGVLGFAELLRRADLDTETRELYAATIHTEATRLTKLVESLRQRG